MSAPPRSNSASAACPSVTTVASKPSLRNSGRVLTRGQLIDRVWGADYVGDTKTLDVHVKRLRSKIEADPANPVHLVTVRGLGYKLEG
ncbi:helix-turn-helix domain-containing protein [Mycobacterium sp. E735]|uniref:winged helix-turn-helix domain-containing protein n=1 Tax=Mycobacterium sp. E735 TaxID=1834148 RepID=UPI003510EF8B